MKRAFFLIIPLIMLACTPESVSVGFTCERLSPLMFRFTNTSTGCDSYKWDFGDGTFAFGSDALHTYDAPGTYTVTLIADVNGIRYDQQQIIDVTRPAIYIAGYTLYNVPYFDRYYKLVFKDDALFPSSWDFQTAYTPMIDAAYLPYAVTFSTPYPIDSPDEHDYWTVTLIRSSNPSSSNNDVQCTKQKITRTMLYQYPNEHILQTESGASRFAVLMQYVY